MTSTSDILVQHPLISGIICLIITAVWVYVDIMLHGECKSPIAFILGILTIILLSMGIYVTLADILEKSIENYSVALLVTLVIGIAIILFARYFLIPFTNGMPGMLMVPILVSVFTAFLTGVICIFGSVYKFIKR